MNIDPAAYVTALVALHEGLDRQGPGDLGFAREILARLPDLPGPEPIADLGCGSGAASLLLAESFGRPVVCVDLAEPFLRSLHARARRSELAHLIHPVCADMASLDPADHQYSLIWSEGAAYHLTFAGALQAWRPLLVPGGLAVISEMTWFDDDRPAEAAAFWEQAYPAMGSERDNVELARQHGFEVLFVERLPAQAWVRNYYGPVLARAEELEGDADPAMQLVIAEMRQEADLFGRFGDHYGYCFYALRRTGVR